MYHVNCIFTLVYKYLLLASYLTKLFKTCKKNNKSYVWSSLGLMGAFVRINCFASEQNLISVPTSYYLVPTTTTTYYFHYYYLVPTSTTSTTTTYFFHYYYLVPTTSTTYYFHYYYLLLPLLLPSTY